MLPLPRPAVVTGRRNAAAGIAAVVAIALIGCGGSSDDSEPAASPPQGRADTTPAPDAEESARGERDARPARRSRPVRRSRREARRDGRARRRDPGRRAERQRTQDLSRRDEADLRARRERATRAAFIRGADRLCRRFASRERALRRRAGSSTQEQAAYYDALSRVVNDIAERIGLLRRPQADRATVDRYLTAVQRNASLLLRLADALDRGDQRGASVLTRRIRATGLRANRIARGYGFRVCGSR